MVRFSWHVEDGLQAYLPPGAYTTLKESAVRHAACEIEIPQSKETLEALLTLPAEYLDVEKVKDTGVVLGHGNDPAEWRGKLLTDIAVFLASQGYVVMRYCCKHKEQRRQRMCEKALDACATSPFARGVKRWVLAGLGSGGRVAAVVGSRCRGDIAGFVMLSYPLKEPIPQPAAKPRRGEDDLSPPPKSSESPLFGVERPILFLLGDSDEFCTRADLDAVTSQLQAPSIRVELFEDADQDFKSPTQGKGPASSVLRRVCACILDFIVALEAEDAQTAAGDAAGLPARAPADAGTASGATEAASAIKAARTEGLATPPAQDPAFANGVTMPVAQGPAHPSAGGQEVDAGSSADAQPGPARDGGAAPAPSELPGFVQQMLGSQAVPDQARQLLNALAAQRAQYTQAQTAGAAHGAPQHLPPAFPQPQLPAHVASHATAGPQHTTALHGTVIQTPKQAVPGTAHYGGGSGGEAPGHAPFDGDALPGRPVAPQPPPEHG